MGWLSKILKVGSGHRITEKNYQTNYEEDPNSHLPSTSEGLWSENENEDIDRAIAISLVEESQKANNVIDRDYQLEEDELLAKAVQESLNLESPPQHTSETCINLIYLNINLVPGYVLAAIMRLAMDVT